MLQIVSFPMLDTSFSSIVFIDIENIKFQLIKQFNSRYSLNHYKSGEKLC
jgi:hypothetical protein